MSFDSSQRVVVEARLLGQEPQDKTRKRFRRKEVEYALEVILSDESQYTTYRTIKEIASFHSQLMSKFPMEAGYFNDDERCIPECPVKQTIFGPSRVASSDNMFGKLLNSYIKELPGLPASIVKSSLMQKFFELRASDIGLPEQSVKKKKNRIVLTEDSTITGPVKLRNYYTVSTYSDPKTNFKLTEGAIVSVLQKDTSGWWMVDAGSGILGWAPASFLVPVDNGDLQEEAKENQQIVKEDRVGARYISRSSYQASRADELSFVRGAVVRVIKKYHDGWWLVRYNGGEGFVPGSLFRKFDRRQSSMYVKKIKRKFTNRTSTKIVPTVKPKWMTSVQAKPLTVGESGQLVLYQSMADFTGSPEQSELSLNKNTMVKVLDKRDHGWWFVEDFHGRAGWAPATYLKPVLDKTSDECTLELVGSSHQVFQAHLAIKEDELTVERGDNITVIWPCDNGWWMVKDEATMEQGLIPVLCMSDERVGEGEEEEFDRGSESYNGQLELRDIAGDSRMNDYVDEELVLEDCYVADRDYKREAVDELDVFEGQIVCVIDDSDQDQWYVNVDGKEGWLPSSCLRPLAEEELASISREGSCSSSYASADISNYQSDTETTPRRSVSPSPILSRREKIHRRSSSPQPILSRKERAQRCSRSPPPNSQATVVRHKPRVRPAIGRSHSRDSSPVPRRRHHILQSPLASPNLAPPVRQARPRSASTSIEEERKNYAPKISSSSSHSDSVMGFGSWSSDDSDAEHGFSRSVPSQHGFSSSVPTSGIAIYVENKSLEELEKEIERAEMAAVEAQRRAVNLWQLALEKKLKVCLIDELEYCEVRPGEG